MDNTISEDLIQKKIFIARRSQLESRLDPIFYSSDFAKFLKKYTPVRLASVCLSFKSGIGAGKDVQSDAEEGIIQIRPTNIDNEGFLKFEKNIYVPWTEQTDLLEPDTVLFNNTNSQELVGKTAILKDNVAFTYSNHITAICVDKDQILPEYLWIILNLYQQNKIFYSICTNWNNQSGVGVDVLKSLRIPLADKETQQQIVNLYEDTFRLKQKEEKAAEKLLATIDNYLLERLGVVRPELKRTLDERIFETTLQKITGGRLDPKLYDKTTSSLREAIFRSPFVKVDLNTLIVNSCSGDWGIDENIDEKNLKDYERCLVIRATEFDNRYNLDLENSRVKFRLIKKEKLLRMNIHPNDILIEKSGGSPDQPVGRVAIISEEVYEKYLLCYSNFVHKIRIDEKKINPMYLFYFLKVMYNIKITESMQSQTNGIRNLILSEYFQQKIILPSLIEQGEIVSCINSIFDEAKFHQSQARILENIIKRVFRNIW